MAIATSLLTMGVSAAFSGLMTIWSQSIKAKQAFHMMALGKGKEQAAIYDSARKYDSPGIQWTRRVIALMVIFFAVCWPLIIPLFPNAPDITIMWNELSGGFWFFKDAKMTLKSATYNNSAVVYTPMMQDTMAAIIGFFFGNQITK